MLNFVLPSADYHIFGVGRNSVDMRVRSTFPVRFLVFEVLRWHYFDPAIQVRTCGCESSSAISF